MTQTEFNKLNELVLKDYPNNADGNIAMRKVFRKDFASILRQGIGNCTVVASKENEIVGDRNAIEFRVKLKNKDVQINVFLKDVSVGNTYWSSNVSISCGETKNSASIMNVVESCKYLLLTM